MKKLRELRSLYCSIEGQGQETQHMVYPLQNDRLYYNVCLRIKNLAAKLQMAIASHMKLYRVLFVLLVAAKRHILEQICQVASTGVILIVVKQAGSVSRLSKQQCGRVYSNSVLTVFSSFPQGDGYGS